MSDRSRAFQIKIVGDVADAKRSLGQIEGKMSKFGSLMKGVAGGMAAAFAVKKVFDFGASAVKRAEEMNSAYAITAKIIEQTNGAAGKTAEEIKKANRQLSLRTGIDKALITSGTNVLLTFKSIHDEVGAGNDVFSRAQMVALDMGAVFGGDMKQSATQLGKALEDPIKGVAALARVGVTFTEQEKEKIKALVESGKTLEAQKLILDALEGQVGGSAEASADATAKISNAWAEVKEWLGNIILPLLEKLATWVWEVAIPAFTQFGAFISKVWGQITSIFKGGSSDQLETAKGWLTEIIGYYQDFAKMVMAIVKRFIAIATWVWENYGEQISAVFRSVWSDVSAAITLIIGVLRGLIQFITAVFNGDWAGAWEAAKSIVTAFWDFFKGLPGRMVDALRSAVGLVGRAAMDLGKAIINGIIGFWNRLDPKITMGPLPSWLPGIGGKKYTSPDLFPDIPQLAKGGIVRKPTLAMIGEAGSEAVIPLRPGFGMGGGGPISITVNTGVGDPAAIGNAVADVLVAYELTSGTGWRERSAAGG